MASVMAASLAACGGSSSSSSTTAAASSAAETTAAAAESASGSESAADSGKTYDSPEFTIKLGHSDTTANILNTTLEDYAAWVKEQTKGRVEIDIYAAEQLGSNSEMAEMIEMGELDAMAMPQGNEASFAPKIATLGLPFLFTSYEQAWAAMDDEEIASSLTEGLEDHNMIQIAFWENGLRQITNSRNAINTPDDLKGMKIRTPEDDMTIAIFRALGASPSPLAFSETYLALQQKTYDGQENPIANIYANNFQDVQKYLALTNHKYESKNIIFSTASWNKYPEEVQQVLTEGAKKFGQEHRDAIVAAQDKQLQELKDAGMEVTEPDAKPFQDATASVYTDFEAENDWASDLVSKIQTVIADVK